MWSHVTRCLVYNVSTQLGGIIFIGRMSKKIEHSTLKDETTTLPRKVGRLIPNEGRPFLEETPQLTRD